MKSRLACVALTASYSLGEVTRIVDAGPATMTKVAA